MVKFYRGLRANYKYPENIELQDVIFFSTDTHEILINGQNYGGEELEQYVKDVTFNADTNTFTFTKNNNTEVVVSLGDKLLTVEDRTLLEEVKRVLSDMSASVIYDSAYKEDPTKTTEFAVGGISKGETLSNLQGNTISSILDKMFFPVIAPTFVQPSATLSLSGYNTPVIVGSNAPTTANFTKNFKRGEVQLRGKKVNDYCTSEDLTEVIYCGTEDNGMPEKVTEGTSNYYYKVTYGESDYQPVDSAGQPSGNPCPAGSKTSGAVTINGTYPWYATTVDGKTLTQGKLINWSTSNITTPEVALKPKSAESDQMFRIPRQLKKLEMYNSVAKAYEVIPSTAWAETTEDIQLNDQCTRTYYLYTYTGEDRGEVKLKITF